MLEEAHSIFVENLEMTLDSFGDVWQYRGNRQLLLGNAILRLASRKQHLLWADVSQPSWAQVSAASHLGVSPEMVGFLWFPFQCQPTWVEHFENVSFGSAILVFTLAR